MTEPTPEELLEGARALVAASDPSGAKARAATFLIRDALESSLKLLWIRRAPGLHAAPFHTQLICLPEYLGDPDLARRAAWTWAALSEAAHGHGYEFAAAPADLEAWLGATSDLVAQVRKKA